MIKYSSTLTIPYKFKPELQSSPLNSLLFFITISCIYICSTFSVYEGQNFQFFSASVVFNFSLKVNLNFAANIVQAK